jgi:hypothetical protein
MTCRNIDYDEVARGGGSTLPAEVRAVRPDGTVIHSQVLGGGYIWPHWTVPGADGALWFGRDLGTWRGPWRIEARWDDEWELVSESA